MNGAADIKTAIDALSELKEDIGVPKNIKTKVESVICTLNHDSDNSIKINKALHEIEEISEDANLQPYTRTQIFNIVSILEMLH